MVQPPWEPPGLTGRRRRLSEDAIKERAAETKRRMLETGRGLVEQSGLTVSVGHLSFEDVIREAEVPRSAAYKVWSYKEDFFADLLRELAGATNPGQAAFDQGTVALAAGLGLQHLEQLRSAEGRRASLVELARLGAWQNFTKIYGSSVWQTYVALIATFGSLEASDIHDDIGAGLYNTELQFVHRMADVYRVMLRYLGYRLQPDLPDYETFAVLGGAVVEGLALNATIVPSVATTRFYADPFGVGSAEWTLPGLGFTSVLLGVTQPDPNYEHSWSVELVPKLREMT